MASECPGHCWVAVWIGGVYTYVCLNCGEVQR